jgi:ABC-2 type transport system permease protein
VFYAVALLPSWARTLSYGNPILHMVNAFRFGFLGISDVNIGIAFAMMGASFALLFILAVVMMDRGVGIRD